jgi:hypothetical protein
MFGLHREAFVRPPQGAGVERRARFCLSFFFHHNWWVSSGYHGENGTQKGENVSKIRQASQFLNILSLCARQYFLFIRGPPNALRPFNEGFAWT